MIAILGGTFDPIHLGHIHIASRVLEQLPVEQVHFMPCAQPVHRGSPQASAEQRCDMIALEIANQPKFVLNRIEIDRDGPSYSVDSLRDLHAQGYSRLVLILGSDSFAGLADWKQPDEILRLAHLVVCQRPGTGFQPGNFAMHCIESAQQFESREAGAILPLEVDAPDCASSLLRQRLANNENPGDCLGSAVAEYIDQQGLYGRD